MPVVDGVAMDVVVVVEKFALLPVSVLKPRLWVRDMEQVVPEERVSTMTEAAAPTVRRQVSPAKA